MGGKKTRGIGVRANATSAGGEFMSQDSAAVADCAVPDESDILNYIISIVALRAKFDI